ncbi:MAG TPA: hypothetical protein VGQ18_14410 [Gemmatimonadales bacterium]|nr:hypothetical protein [Gemmatimonadales bacterium]
MRRLSPGLVLLRATAVLALVLLLWNPTATRALAPDAQPIVLLDASLSMTNEWRAALDSARALAGRGGALVWRFGDRVAAFDSAAPGEGTSHLAPALEAAAARGGQVIVVTDGAVDDALAMPSDLLRRPRIVLVPRPPFFDAFVASVDGPRRVTSSDTVRLRVSYGAAGKRDAGRGTGTATLVVSSAGRHLTTRRVSLPDSGTLSTDITLPPSLVPRPGWQVLDARLEGGGDPEPRDDARQFVIEVSPQPAAVLFASPPDWETRFLARALSDVARIPVKTFVETEPGRWRDAATLAPAAPADMRRAAQGARLVAMAGDPERSRAFVPPSAALLVWTTARGGGQAGDWYVERPSPSPLTSVLAGVVWDSLPPAVAVGETPRDSGVITVLTARLARRGSPRPIVTLEPRGRHATVAAAGLWRWAFRGGASAEAYRAVIAGLTDWLLGAGEGRRERAVPVALETPNGLPLSWRWTGTGEARPLPIDLQSEKGARRDTLRFDAAGRAELRLPPGAYHYSLGTAPSATERGVVVVEEYSDEWRPAAPSVTAQPGLPAERVALIGLRDRWWLFAIAIAAFAAEWAWRRRQGLP